MHNTYLSIIIPCYNVEDYLPATIQSLRTLENAEDCEFIFINDGSTDNTLKIILNFAEQDQRVVVIDQINSGVSAARNAALEIVQGKYFLPLDGDDKLRPNAVSIIRKSILDADLLITPVEHISKDTITDLDLPFKAGIYTPASLFKSCKIFPTASKLVHKTDIAKKYNIRFSETIHSGEVLTYTCSFLKYCNSIAVSQECFYQYVTRESSATHAPNYQKDYSVLTIIDYINEHTNPTIEGIYSFQATIFRMCTTFTYNKYAKHGLTEEDALETIRKVINQSSYKHLQKTILFSVGHYSIDRLLALYIMVTGVWGYKILAWCAPKFAHYFVR